MDTDIRFNFQQLDVYRRAIEFLSLATLMLDQMPRGYTTIADQFSSRFDFGSAQNVGS
jgi:hypothetical protein